jgi:hypothetical protein
MKSWMAVVVVAAVAVAADERLRSNCYSMKRVAVVIDKIAVAAVVAADHCTMNR